MNNFNSFGGSNSVTTGPLSKYSSTTSFAFFYHWSEKESLEFLLAFPFRCENFLESRWASLGTVPRLLFWKIWQHRRCHFSLLHSDVQQLGPFSLKMVINTELNIVAQVLFSSWYVDHRNNAISWTLVFFLQRWDCSSSAWLNIICQRGNNCSGSKQGDYFLPIVSVCRPFWAETVAYPSSWRTACLTKRSCH